MKVKTFLGDLVYGIGAGLCIGIGGTVYLSVEDKVVGALLFSIGLLTILYFGLNLYTGKIGYFVKNLCDKNMKSYLPMLLATILGNAIGTYGLGTALKVTRIYSGINEKAAKLSEVKVTDSYLSLFVLAVVCGMLMFIAVDTFNRKGSQLVVVFAVAVFILCGAEHSIADMFYFAAAGRFDTFPELIVIILGNAVGGNLIPVLQLAKKSK